MRHQHLASPQRCSPSIQRTAKALLLLSFFLAALAPKAGAQATYVLSNALTIATGTGNLSGGATTVRGMAYNAVSNQVLAANDAGSIDAFNGTNGTLVGALSTSGLSGGTFLVDQIGVAADGAIYAINLSTASTSANKVYQWANWQATPTTAFSGNALANGTPISYTSGRIGDTLAVTGSGTSTLLLAGVGSITNFVLFYTANGTTFSPVIINVPSGYTAGGNVYGICFFTNDTFLVKSSSGGNGTVYVIGYPANYASSTLVTGTVLGTTTLSSGSSTTFNATTMLSYSPTFGLLAAVETGNSPSGVSPVGLFSFTNLATGATLLTTSNATTSYAGGNATGAVAINGTNSIYELTTGNPLYNFAIISVPPVPPTISSAPIGGTFYASNSLSVTATGTQPFAYQWLASTNDTTNAVSFATIANATNKSLAITTASTNYYEVIVTNVAGSITSAPVQVTILPAVTNSAVTNLWRVAIGTTGYSYMANDNNCRGLGFDTNTLRLVVTSITGGTSLNILDAKTGTNIGTLSTTGVSFGGLLGGVDQCGIADDGAVYAGNLVSGNGFTLFRWPGPITNATGVQSFSDGGVLGGADRWGDTMAVRGAGSNTQILLGSRSGTNVALLTTDDGTNFSGEYIPVSNSVPLGFAAYGVAFGAGNTFWAKSYGGDLYEIGFDPVQLTNTVLLDYTKGSQIPSAMGAIAVDMTNNILGGVDLADVNNDLQLFQLTGTANPPVLFDQAFFPSYNANGNENAVVVMKYPYAFALDVNNGLVAVGYGVPSSTPPTISQPPASVAVYSTDPSLTLSAVVSGSLPLYYQWQSNNVNIPNATNSTLVLTNLSTNSSGSFDVVVHNIAGSRTSAAAELTVFAPITGAGVVPLWSVAAGSNGYPYLDTSSYNTRGIAYDTNTSTVLISGVGETSVANQGIFVLDADTGTNMFDLNTAGLNSGNGILFPTDQIGAGDDGVIYAANCVEAGAGTNFDVYSWSSVNAGVSPQFAYEAQSGDAIYTSLDRWGDTMDVRGAGTNTEILLGSYNGFDGGPATNAALLEITNGSSFTSLLLTVTNAGVTIPQGFCSLGIAFGASNTFWAKSPGYDLREFAFDPVTGNCDLMQDISNAASAESAFLSMGAIALDPANNLLAGIAFGDTPMDVAMYQLGAPGSAPYLFEQAFFVPPNANRQFNGATVVKYPRVYAMDANNGILGFTYTVPSTAPSLTSFSITSVVDVPGTGVTITWQSVPEFQYQVQVATTLAGVTVWSNLGAPVVATGTTTSYVDTSDNVLTTAYYRVIAY